MAAAHLRATRRPAPESGASPPGRRADAGRRTRDAAGTRSPGRRRDTRRSRNRCTCGRATRARRRRPARPAAARGCRGRARAAPSPPNGGRRSRQRAARPAGTWPRRRRGSGYEVRPGGDAGPQRSAPPPAAAPQPRRNRRRSERAQRQKPQAGHRQQGLPARPLEAGPPARRPSWRARSPGQRQSAAHPRSSSAGGIRRPGAAPAIEGAGEDSRTMPNPTGVGARVAAAASDRREGEPGAAEHPAAFGARPQGGEQQQHGGHEYAGVQVGPDHHRRGWRSPPARRAGRGATGRPGCR